MAKKFYAVRKGKKPGIYENWTECQVQINGYSGAEFKGFATYEEALAFVNCNQSNNIKEKKSTNNKDIKLNDSFNIDNAITEAVAYVDGSYNSQTKQFSCGVVLFYKGKEEHFAELYDDTKLAEMHNVAGEIKGSEKAITYCLNNNIKSLTIYHDYEGIAKWCNGEWQAKKEGTKAYKDFFDRAAKMVEIHFVKVKGHSGDKYNDIADKLAKSAFQSE